MTKVLITGVNGFVGKTLSDELVIKGFNVNGTVRSVMSVDFPGAITKFVIKDINLKTDWQNALEGVDMVIHLAARVHVMKDTAIDALSEFRRVNVEGTLNLARQAVEAGVQRFIFISSIKVNGEGSILGQPYTPEDQPAPVDPYGISKREAEDGLRQLASETGMEVVIIRPPLVYGPGVKANFQSMMRWLDKGIPLPLGAIHNQRSPVSLDNLIDLIATCIHHPAAANQTFLAGDGEDISTTELLQRMAAALGKKAWLIPVPSFILEWGARLVGKQAITQKLCGSLQVDISKARDLLDWKPPVSVDEALRKTAQYYMKFHK
ncbi:MAG: SDR family oxidoreductase [Methylococcaceae bacterium]|nr:SDR family oxidoreductase [Methylococcaceae bacterium]